MIWLQHLINFLITPDTLLFNTPFRLHRFCQVFPNKQELQYLSCLPFIPTGLKKWLASLLSLSFPIPECSGQTQLWQGLLLSLRRLPSVLPALVLKSSPCYFFCSRACLHPGISLGIEHKLCRDLGLGSSTQPLTVPNEKAKLSPREIPPNPLYLCFLCTWMLVLELP